MRRFLILTLLGAGLSSFATVTITENYDDSDMGCILYSDDMYLASKTSGGGVNYTNFWLNYIDWCNWCKDKQIVATPGVISGLNYHIDG
jgi:hypothetical protein